MPAQNAESSIGEAARGYALGLVSQGWHLLTAFALYAVLARAFGPERFGDWRLALSVLSWFEITIISGIPKSVVKAIAENPADAASLTRAAYLGQLVIACGVFALMFATADPVAAMLGAPSLAPLLRLAALDIPVFAVLVVASAYLLGVDRFRRQAVGWMVYATSKAVLVGLLAVGRFSVEGALIGNALSSIVGIAALAVPLPRSDGAFRRARHGAATLTIAALPFLSLALLAGLNMTTDLWIVGAVFSGTSAVGLFAAAAILAEVPVFLFVGLNRVVFPRVARAHASGDTLARDRSALLGIRLAIVVCVMGVAVAAWGGEQLLSLVFSATYAAAAAPLAWLMLAALGRTVMSTACEVLAACDRMRFSMWAMALTGVAQVIGVTGLSTRYGLSGAAAGAAVASVLGAAATVFAIRDLVGSRPLVTLLRSSIAAAIAAAPLALVYGGNAVTMAVFLLCSLAYVGLLVAVRELSRSDIQSLRAGRSERAVSPIETEATRL